MAVAEAAVTTTAAYGLSLFSYSAAATAQVMIADVAVAVINPLTNLLKSYNTHKLINLYI